MLGPPQAVNMNNETQGIFVFFCLSLRLLHAASMSPSYVRPRKSARAVGVFLSKLTRGGPIKKKPKVARSPRKKPVWGVGGDKLAGDCFQKDELFHMAPPKKTRPCSGNTPTAVVRLRWLQVVSSQGQSGTSSSSKRRVVSHLFHKKYAPPEVFVFFTGNVNQREEHKVFF